MAATKASKKEIIEKTFADAAAAAIKAEEAASKAVEDDGRLAMKNKDGGVLMCNLTVAKRPFAPDPLCVTVNDEIKWIKRGAKVIVPWYFVLHMNNNVETRFRQEKDAQGKNIVVPETGPSEPISYNPINPADDNPNWL